MRQGMQYIFCVFPDRDSKLDVCACIHQPHKSMQSQALKEFTLEQNKRGNVFRKSQASEN